MNSPARKDSAVELDEEVRKQRRQQRRGLFHNLLKRPSADAEMGDSSLRAVLSRENELVQVIPVFTFTLTVEWSWNNR